MSLSTALPVPALEFTVSCLGCGSGVVVEREGEPVEGRQVGALVRCSSCGKWFVVQVVMRPIQSPLHKGGNHR